MGKRKKDKTPVLLKLVRWLFPMVERLWPALAHGYFVKIFFTPLRYSIPHEEKQLAAQATRFSIHVANKKVQCYAWGDATRVVLLVHGWAGRATQFRSFVPPLLAAGFRAVAFDAPAHGASGGRTTTIYEFEEAFKALYSHVGEPEGIIAHSFGGGAVLFSVMNGLPVKRLVNIASPTIGDAVINTYLAAINASPATGIFFKNYILKTYGRPFDEFTAMYFIKHLKAPLQLLLIHDEDDREVAVQQATALQQAYPAAQLYKTNGLGHTRILRDAQVIKHCIAFIKNG